MKGKGKRGSRKPFEDYERKEELKMDEVYESVGKIDGSIDEIIIYSSSHFSEKRGLKKLLISKLDPKEFHLTFRVNGGRMWDSHISQAYKVFQKEGQSPQKLHVILLGDNDVRQLTPEVHGGRQKWVPPFVEKFGKTVNKAREMGISRGDTVFVNGILPFPIFNLGKAPILITNFYRMTKALSTLIEFDPSIHYIPIRANAVSFCEKKSKYTHELFKSDRVHLNELGEEFVAEHLVRQIKAFRCAKRFIPNEQSFRFFDEIVNINNGNVIERHLKVSVDTDFFDADLGKRVPTWLHRSESHKAEKIEVIEQTEQERPIDGAT